MSSEYESDIEDTEGEQEEEEEDPEDKNPVGEYFGARNKKEERHGRGRAVLPNGDIYLGCYYRGNRHGLGVYMYKNGFGARYGGDWSFGEKHGWGTLYYPDGSQYTGNWENGEKHGWGVYIYANKDEYEGWWYMGLKNGRGIYRTKKTGEKFVGQWIMGRKQGAGMLIRSHHRFIGEWQNDMPKGPGVYIFPELQVEQHGQYTHLKINEGSVEKWKESGYQVFTVNDDSVLEDPVQIERERIESFASNNTAADFIDGGGDGDEDSLAAGDRFRKSVEDAYNEIKTDLRLYLEKIALESENESKKDISIVPLWSVTKITGLQTSIPDEMVPPPPIPPTPQPPYEPEEEESVIPPEGEAQKEGENKEDPCIEESDPISKARRLTLTHALGTVYGGSGIYVEADLHIKGTGKSRICPEGDKNMYQYTAFKTSQNKNYQSSSGAAGQKYSKNLIESAPTDESGFPDFEDDNDDKEVTLGDDWTDEKVNAKYKPEVFNKQEIPKIKKVQPSRFNIHSEKSLASGAGGKSEIGSMQGRDSTKSKVKVDINIEDDDDDEINEEELVGQKKRLSEDVAVIEEEEEEIEEVKEIEEEDEDEPLVEKFDEDENDESLETQVDLDSMADPSVAPKSQGAFSKLETPKSKKLQQSKFNISQKFE